MLRFLHCQEKVVGMLGLGPAEIRKMKARQFLWSSWSRCPGFWLHGSRPG
jgi:hypothetical protein